MVSLYVTIGIYIDLTSLFLVRAFTREKKYAQIIENNFNRPVVYGHEFHQRKF